jgi:hypothetical protein
MVQRYYELKYNQTHGNFKISAMPFPAAFVSVVLNRGPDWSNSATARLFTRNSPGNVSSTANVLHDFPEPRPPTFAHEYHIAVIPLEPPDSQGAFSQKMTNETSK